MAEVISFIPSRENLILGQIVVYSLKIYIFFSCWKMLVPTSKYETVAHNRIAVLLVSAETEELLNLQRRRNVSTSCLEFSSWVLYSQPGTADIQLCTEDNRR